MNAYTELIDNYLNNELSAEDRLAFEEQLKTNAALKSEFDLQSQVIQGVQRMALKNQVKTSFQKTKTAKTITKALIAAGITVAVLATGYFVKKQLTKEKEPLHYEYSSEAQNSISTDTGMPLSSQTIRINPLRDTVIETSGGILFAIEANTFLDPFGKTATNPIELDIIEALTPFDIMKAGLSTMSNGQLLETGGMFYLGAQSGNDSLHIDPKKPIQASVPYNGTRNDMMLFDGKREADGTINWVNPIKTIKQLTTTDITKLNFYPPHYLDSLKKWGYNIKDKKFTDSLYYSFICRKEEKKITDEVKQTPDSVLSDDGRTYFMTLPKTKAFVTASSSITGIANPMKDSSFVAKDVSYECNEINPSRIKAIWDKKFNKTILATHQFEKRLQVIFQTCNEKLLNLYINNLHRNIYEIDSMAATLCSGAQKQQFLEFYKQKDGGVKIENKKMQALQKYATDKKELYEKVALQTIQKLWKEEQEKNGQAWVKQYEHMSADWIRNNKNYGEELGINLTSAYKQLGYSYTPPAITAVHSAIIPPPSTYVSAPIITTGWKNVDAYTRLATFNRTSLNYTDPTSGKKAAIQYKPVNVSVEKSSEYDKILGYLVPEQLSSFQLMKTTTTGCTENLNELIKYNMVVIGIKGDKMYYSETKGLLPQQYTVSLKESSEDQLREKLNASYALSKQDDILNDIQYQFFDIKEMARQKKIADREKFKAKIYPVIFPCGVYENTWVMETEK